MKVDDARKSVLIIGATGRTGIECLRKLAAHPSRPSVHAFCRDLTKFNKQDRLSCTSIAQGDARNSFDIECALKSTMADTVIVSVGNGDNVAKSDIRTASADALVKVLKKKAFKHVQVIVVSSIGAGASKIIVGLGMGTLISYHLRHVLDDHTGQEAAFKSIMNRTTIIRPTTLVDDWPTGKLVEFGDTEKGPSLKTDRKDLATLVVQEVVKGVEGYGIVNVTGVKNSCKQPSESPELDESTEIEV